MSIIEQIVREEIRNVITEIVRAELAKVTGSVPVTTPVVAEPEPVNVFRLARKHGALTRRLSQMGVGHSIMVTPRSKKRARSSVAYASKKFGMRFSMRQHGKGYRIFCLQEADTANLEKVYA